MYNITSFQAAWQPVAAAFMNSPPMQRIATGNITIEHYQSILRQIFHHARENPQIQALATVYFRGEQRCAIRKFYQHAISEIGHDQLALNDLKTLGVDVAAIPYERPLPATSALLGYAFYQIQNLNPVGYLGYLFFLEFLPTQHGSGIMQTLERLGVPPTAMSFLEDHTRIDVGHNKMMESYLEMLVKTEADFDAVVYAMRVTGQLYAAMVQDALEQIDAPQAWGIAAEELPAKQAGIQQGAGS